MSVDCEDDFVTLGSATINGVCLSCGCKSGYHKSDCVVLKASPKGDPVDHPAHYTSLPAACSKCGHPIECIDVTQHMGFTLGNAVKYIWRAGLKGALLDDLRKARWYIERAIAQEEKKP